MSFPNTYANTRPPRENPCVKCKKADNCKGICIARARWWDVCLEKAKKKNGAKK